MTMNDPTIGPRTVPIPPTIAGRRISMLTSRSNTVVGRIVLKYIAQNAPGHAVKKALTATANSLYR